MSSQHPNTPEVGWVVVGVFGRGEEPTLLSHLQLEIAHRYETTVLTALHFTFCHIIFGYCITYKAEVELKIQTKSIYKYMYV